MDDLLPCPFCGGEAIVGRDMDSDWFAACQNPARCNALVEGYLTEAEAITAWNTRSSPPLPSDRMVEAVAQQVGSVIYGSETDPFEQPERWDHLEKVARAAIRALSEGVG